MEMTRENLKAFRVDFQNAVKALENKYGVKIEMGSISYTENDFHTKVTVTNGRTNLEAEKAQFEKNVQAFKLYGLSKDDYRRPFEVQGKLHFLVGFKPRARKNMFIIESVNGTHYVCSAEMLGLKYDLSNFKVNIVK